MSDYRKPRQARAIPTFEAILEAGAQLLGEIGIERISSNLVCERAGVTPPAFYRYFDDKYALVAALADRLMERQNEVLEQWLVRQQGASLEEVVGDTIGLLRETARIGDEMPGSLWILRALRAIPRLASIRLESHAYVTGRLTDLYEKLLPDVSRAVLERRNRLAVDLGYAIDEMIRENDIDREAVFEDARPLFQAMIAYPEYPGARSA
ncbi:TetR family transcriptional regulator [Novosphingobium sp. Rr 2-17]|uniref:TetR/AcrR family transcriptional regulator n=1 Tax=Novosphingobium sp. Rr 2-17 TaxID=555793 RepID=UPI0002699C10|nr:TetR/AcrR family transcriptional regulator [Novosphingobium sp. Rr 2-17]EIZ77423.1 TetR family transcriptional regulator [Novosphingobium sp. Rr 2-17]